MVWYGIVWYCMYVCMDVCMYVCMYVYPVHPEFATVDSMTLQPHCRHQSTAFFSARGECDAEFQDMAPQEKIE